MDRKTVEERLKQLTDSRGVLVKQIGLHDGAIQECEHWLAEIDKAEVAEKAKSSLAQKATDLSPG